MLFIMDFLLNVILSGSFYKLSLTDGSNIDVKADNVTLNTTSPLRWNPFLPRLLPLTCGGSTILPDVNLQWS